MNAFINGFMGTLGAMVCIVVVSIVFGYLNYNYGLEALSWIVNH